MSDEYLAEGFAHVDERADGAAYSRCLGLIDSLPYYREWKRRSYELLSLSPGLSVLDVGCGVGDDVFRIADFVAPGGFVVGADRSARMIDEANSRAPEGSPVGFCLADACCLPFQDGYFERCRIDRTLQHIRLPEEAVGEMARVLKPGGIFLAYDNDWGTFTLSGYDHKTTRIMEDLWQDSFTNKWVGRYLRGYFLEARLRDIEVHPSVSVITEFELADQVYNLRQTAKRAVKSGVIPEETADQWLSDLQYQSKEGAFFCSLSAFMVRGRRS